MIAYNHAGYIAQALDSVISQKVNFEYEILVGEDRSTDGTLGIVQEYQARYPDRIRVITEDEFCRLTLIEARRIEDGILLHWKVKQPDAR